MKYLVGDKEKRAREYMNIAIKIAEYATCLRRKCGAVVVKENEIIGEGYNSPPGNSEENRRCLKDKKTLDNKVTDKTCCIHAEQRALDDALDKYNKSKLRGAILFFASVDDGGDKILSGKPYCTMCSKSALDKGLKGWVLEEERGLCFYEANEYNRLSFEFRG